MLRHAPGAAVGLVCRQHPGASLRGRVRAPGARPARQRSSSSRRRRPPAARPGAPAARLTSFPRRRPGRARASSPFRPATSRTRSGRSSRAKYRDGLGRSLSSTYVDLEGDIVWTQEYLRYRVNQCDHATADAEGVRPDRRAGHRARVRRPAGAARWRFRRATSRTRSARSSSASTATVCGGAATSSYVDIEGSIVWTQEYLRYRVNRCGHAAATSKVLNQIDGQGIAPTCWDALSGFWDGTSTYFNAPFTMDIWMRDTRILGTYVDRHDPGYIDGTYSGGSTVVMNVNFGDGGIQVDGRVRRAGPDPRHVPGHVHQRRLPLRDDPASLRRRWTRHAIESSSCRDC